MLSDDFAPRRWLLIRDDQSTTGSLVNVIILGLGLDRSQTKRQGNQSCTSDDTFHKQSPLAPVDRAKGMPARSFPRMRLNTPRSALAGGAKQPWSMAKGLGTDGFTR